MSTCIMNDENFQMEEFALHLLKRRETFTPNACLDILNMEALCADESLVVRYTFFFFS
jgi:hypothetical protein